MLECLKVWLNPKKIHKLKLTNSFNELAIAFLRILFGKMLVRSDKTIKFEDTFKERFNVKAAIMFPHARTALHFILKSMNLEKGDEVLMTPLTIADMVNSIHTLGLKPVFVDIEPDTYCLDVRQLERSITSRSKVILITYIFGIVPDMTKIKKIAQEHGLKIIEDCSQCFDAFYKEQKIGTFGEAAFFSLTNFKVCSSLFGGMIITNSENIASRLNDLRDRELLPPQSPMLLKLVVKNLIYTIFFSKGLFSYFTYFVILFLERIDPKITYRLYSGNIKVLLGQHENKLYSEFPPAYLADYSDIQAAVGLASLEKAREVTAIRIKNGELLRDLLRGVPGIAVPDKLDGALNVYWRFPVISEDMGGLKKYLLDHGIDSAPSYLVLCSMEPGFEPYHRFTPNAEHLKKNVLVLEVNEDLDEDDIRRTASIVQTYFSNTKQGAVKS